MAVHQYILHVTDLKDQMTKFSKFNLQNYGREKINFNLGKLKESIKEGVELYGLHKFIYGNQGSENSPYVSASLTWNPNAYDKISNDPHMATLGSTELKWNSASLYEEVNDSTLFRNSYHDTFAFVERTPFSNHKDVKIFLDTFKRTLIRSRISTVKANREEATKFDFCWHNDEQIFLNLRINIPIQTSSNYVIQIINKADNNQNKDLEIDEFCMEDGYAYVYDTSQTHRPFCKKLDSKDRIHMICGVSPWFDYDKLNQCWNSNEYYGQIHPFEMFRMGLISPAFVK
jgi:hypothetical protein